LNLIRPDGTRFLTYVEIDRQLAEERRRAEKLAAKLRELGLDPDTI
jgi:hypothetical protein